MRTIQVFEPPMCCSTGVCGPEPGPEVARFTSDLESLRGPGRTVERFNLSQSPELGHRTRPNDAIGKMEEQLAGACTTEIAAFDPFAALIGGGEADRFDHVVFDTAPTDHTLRLLNLPAAWDGYLAANTSGTSARSLRESCRKIEALTLSDR